MILTSIHLYIYTLKTIIQNQTKMRHFRGELRNTHTMRRLLIRRAVYAATATTAGGTAMSTLCEGGDGDEFLAGAAGVFAVSSLATGIYLLYNRLWIDDD